MTTEEQHDYWLTFHRFQQVQERKFTPIFNAALRVQVRQYTAHGTIMAVTIDPVYSALHKLYYTVPSIWAARSTRDIRTMARKERMPMGFSQRIIDLMQQEYGINLLNLADDITQTTKDTITRVLQQAAIEGFGFDEIVKRVQSDDFTAARARLIARTEVVASANAAATIAAKDTKLVMDKIWISAKDKRTRPHHREVDQSVVAMGDTFTVGASQMQFPGDKAGGASEVCNCRCSVAFIPKRDANGRLMRV